MAYTSTDICVFKVSTKGDITLEIISKPHRPNPLITLKGIDYGFCVAKEKCNLNECGFTDKGVIILPDGFMPDGECLTYLADLRKAIEGKLSKKFKVFGIPLYAYENQGISVDLSKEGIFYALNEECIDYALRLANDAQWRESLLGGRWTSNLNPKSQLIETALGTKVGMTLEEFNKGEGCATMCDGTMYYTKPLGELCIEEKNAYDKYLEKYGWLVE